MLMHSSLMFLILHFSLDFGKLGKTRVYIRPRCSSFIVNLFICHFLDGGDLLGDVKAIV